MDVISSDKTDRQTRETGFSYDYLFKRIWVVKYLLFLVL